MPVRPALPGLQVCSYAQGYNIIRAKSMEQGWDIDLGGLARIWKGGCIIRAGGRQEGAGLVGAGLVGAQGGEYRWRLCSSC